MNEPLDELYLKWLYRQVGNVKLKNPARTYWKLLKLLYTKEFVWIVPNDDNRISDGLDLRHEFVNQEEIDPDPQWMGLGCSMLEMLVALAQCLHFEDENRSPGGWFWCMMENLGLQRCVDAEPYSPQDVDEVLDTVIWRTYNVDGSGGLFPLKHPEADQRDVEIWYQLNAYLLEND